jgi:Uma2 family endonuclease
VILGDPPKEIEALIESRRRTGADRRDELWEGDYHMNPAPRKRHAMLVSNMVELLGPRARRNGLVITTDFNLGVPDDYRIPDGGLHRDASDAVFVDTAPLVIEVLSPDDETRETLPFYAARSVEEVIIADADERRVTWLALVDGSYREAARSELLDLDSPASPARSTGLRTANRTRAPHPSEPGMVVTSMT